MKYFYMFILLAFSNILASQNLNLELVAQVPLDETGNDIWGYVDENGIEYAIMGSWTHTNIFSLEDKANPQLRAKIPGGASTWRDIKDWKTHLYVTNDGSPDGLLVIDMSKAPDTITHNYIQPEVTSKFTTDTLGRCHNLYIDEFGYCYLAGCRISGANKAVIFDLNADLNNPPIVGVYGDERNDGPEYAHDLMVQNNIMYSSEIYAGNLTLFDVTDKANLVELGDAQTTTTFTHNAWASDDGNYVFTTDERANAYVDAFDVSDPENIKLLDSYRPVETEGRGVIPHNTHYHDGFLVTSWYTDGVVVIDGSRPDNLIKVASYDTWEFGDGGFSGCWGAYPWLPSGALLVSNLSNDPGQASVGELYIFEPKYQRACYLEGTVTDANNGDIINNASIVIEADQMNRAATNAMGIYKTGLATAGSYSATYSHPEYFPATVTVDLENGVVTLRDVQLESRPRIGVTMNFVNSENGQSIPNAKISLESALRKESFGSDATGSISEIIFDELYDEIFVGAWGYKNKALDAQSFTEGQVVTIELDPGYQDDFVLDLGWTQTGNPQTGAWVRDTPIGTFNRGNIANIGEDDPNDLGTECYMTGNGGGGGGTDDLDRGITRLVSPLIDVSGYIDPILRYRTHFFTTTNNGQEPLNDTMFVRIFDTEPHTLEMYTEPTGGWTDIREFRLKDYVDLDQELIFGFVVSDLFLAGQLADGQHIVEAAADVFSIVEGETSSTEELITLVEPEVYPNPFEEVLNINLNDFDFNWVQIFDSMGRLVYNQSNPINRLIINQLTQPGMYTILLEKENGELFTKKVIKL